MLMISSLALLLSGCFFLDFIFGPDPEEQKDKDEKYYPDEKEEEKEEPGEKETEHDYDEDEKRETVFYLLDEHENLVPVTTPIEWTEGISQKTLSKMSASQNNLERWQEMELKPTLPENTEVIGIALDNGTARVNFCDSFLDMEPGMEEKVLNSIIYTLTEFETIDEVEILVDGQYIDTLPDGTDASAAQRRDGLNVEVTEEAEEAAEEAAVKLYFINDEDYVVPVTRHIAETDELEGNAIYELMKGPDPNSGLNSYISNELDINEVSIQNSTLKMDITNLTDDQDSENRALKQLELTLIDLDHINEVEISVDGEPVSLEEVMTTDFINFRY